MSNHFPTDSISRIMIIRERDVGLFSMFWQVLNTLYQLHIHQIDRIPVVMLGEGLIYYHPEGHHGRKTVWEYYFDPLVEDFSESQMLGILGSGAMEMLESKRLQLEHNRGAIEFPHKLSTLPPITPRDHKNLAQLDTLLAASDCTWSETFNPAIDGHDPVRINHRNEELANLVRKYIRPNARIRRIVRQIVTDELQGHYVIGVHVRGTDGHNAPSRGVKIPIDRYFRKIENKIKKRGKSACRIFLATDEQSIVSLFKEKFGTLLVCREIVRNTQGDTIFGKGPTGQVVPGYISVDPDIARQNGEDAVIDYALLCRSDCLVHNGSSLSTAAAITVPETIRVNRRYGPYFLHRLVSLRSRYCSRDGHSSSRRQAGRHARYRSD